MKVLTLQQNMLPRTRGSIWFITRKVEDEKQSMNTQEHASPLREMDYIN
jgi:hypothetical protein